MEKIERFTSLLVIDDFHAFLREAIAIRYTQSGQVNLSDFSRRAGFLSRSYVSELLSGKKGLSADSMRRIKDALRLPNKYSKLFELIAQKHFPQIQRAGPQKQPIDKSIAELRIELRQHGKPTKLRKSYRLTNQPYILQTFAALGGYDTGASIPEVMNRTKLDRQRIESCLSILVDHGAVREVENRYYPVTSQLDIFGLKGSQGLEQLVSYVCGDIQDQKRMIIDDPDNLIFYTAASVRKSELAQLKSRMRTAIFDVLDQFQTDDGDHVMQMFFTMHGPNQK